MNIISPSTGSLSNECRENTMTESGNTEERRQIVREFFRALFPTASTKEQIRTACEVAAPHFRLLAIVRASADIESRTDRPRPFLTSDGKIRILPNQVIDAGEYCLARGLDISWPPKYWKEMLELLPES